MAARDFLLRNGAPIATGLFAAAVAFQPRNAYAESPEAASIPKPRKPIYDDPTRSTPPRQAETGLPKDAKQSKQGSTVDDAVRREPTPTDRLTVQIQRARLATYDLSTRVEGGFNDILARAFNLESSFTSTVRSLAPPPNVDEPLVPGFIYILVATLAGSILTRRRGIILRTSVPLAFGVGMGKYAIPHTMQNVGDLIWTYEERFPELAKAHSQASERIESFWETGKAHTMMGGEMLREKVHEAREKAEDWVSKGG